VSKKTFAERIAINPEANKYFKKGNRLFITETVLGFIGGFAIGRGLAPILTGTPLNFKSIGIGAGFMGIGFLVHSSTSKTFTKSVDIYTDYSLGTVQKVKLGLSVGGDGVGLLVRF
jgi:hypothetical protein